MRPVDDPRVAAVLASLERILSTPERDTYDLVDPFHLLLEGFSVEGWSDDALRAVLLTLVTNCPDEDLGVFESWVSRQVEWVNEWEVQRRYERMTGKELPIDVDLAALVRALNGESKPIAATTIGTEAH